MLKKPHIQAVFIEEKNGLTRLMPLLRKDAQNTQLHYLAIFCLWLLSFNKQCFDALKTSGVVGEIAKVLKVSVREKVIRLCFATLKNLLEQPEKFNEEMIGQGLVKACQTMLTRNWKDKDIEVDIKEVSDKLEKAVEELSSFEVYCAEVTAGNLSWTPVHSELFWRENINKFEKNGFDLIKQLIALLEETKEETCLEVAAYDLGEFARFYPGGKGIVEKMGGKGKLIELMTHPSGKVRKQALLCVQKLMVTNWEFLNKAGGKKGQTSQQKQGDN